MPNFLASIAAAILLCSQSLDEFGGFGDVMRGYFDKLEESRDAEWWLVSADDNSFTAINKPSIKYDKSARVFVAYLGLFEKGVLIGHSINKYVVDCKAHTWVAMERHIFDAESKVVDRELDVWKTEKPALIDAGSDMNAMSNLACDRPKDSNSFFPRPVHRTVWLASKIFIKLKAYDVQNTGFPVLFSTADPDHPDDAIFIRQFTEILVDRSNQQAVLDASGVN